MGSRSVRYCCEALDNRLFDEVRKLKWRTMPTAGRAFVWGGEGGRKLSCGQLACLRSAPINDLSFAWESKKWQEKERERESQRDRFLMRLRDRSAKTCPFGLPENLSSRLHAILGSFVSLESGCGQRSWVSELCRPFGLRFVVWGLCRAQGAGAKLVDVRVL